MDKIIAGLLLGFTIFAAVLGLSLLFAIVTQIAWEHSVAEIFKLPLLTFWQAFWLNVLGGMLYNL